MNKKNIKRLILHGTGERSGFITYKNGEMIREESYPISKYTVLFWSGDEDGVPMVASEETNHKIAITMKGARKVPAVVTFGFESESSGDKKSPGLKGILTVMWMDPRDESLNFLWIDGRNQTYKNVSVISYGYGGEETYEMFGSIFTKLAGGLPGRVSDGFLQLSRKQAEGVRKAVIDTK